MIPQLLVAAWLTVVFMASMIVVVKTVGSDPDATAFFFALNCIFLAIPVIALYYGGFWVG